ncbi:MAG: hypothetical protein LIO93_02935 [Bacteroidales bacterium]|nr:hypothetical protein [Bacteroidales bacterium]
MRNKLILLFLFLFCFHGLHTEAQVTANKHDIEVGVGLFSINEIVNIYTDIIVSAFPLNGEMGDGNSYGSIHAAYKYRVTDRLGVGGLFAFDYSKADALLDGRKIGDFRRKHYTLAAEVDFKYLNSKRYVTVYGLAGVGCTLYGLDYQAFSGNSDSDYTPYFTFQITPITIKIGERWGGFAEVGFGYRGILNAGLFYRF